MEERNKTLLRRYRVNLVKDLEPSKLYDALLEKGVFTQDIIDGLKMLENRRDQSRQLVLDLEKRGSRAFPLFLESLLETGQHRLVELLQNGAPTIELQPPTPIKPQPPTTTKPFLFHEDKRNYVPECRSSSTSSPSPEMEHMKPDPGSRTRRDSFPIYKMDASPCGHCLIINNVEFEPQSEQKDRKGSNIDCDKMERRFNALNFIVEVKTNLKQRQIKRELLALSKMDHSQYDCCVVVMLSHGTEVSHNRFPGAVYGVDGQYVLVQHITNYLNGQHCPSLQGKPKLFFIQACGGDEKDTGFEVSTDELEPSIGGEDDETDSIPMSSSSDSLSMSDEPDSRPTLPNLSDILVSYSTSPGYVSWRGTQSGSWYIETLDCILQENAATSDLASMLMMVNNQVSQNSAMGLYKQIPGYFNSLRKHLYFQTSS